MALPKSRINKHSETKQKEEIRQRMQTLKPQTELGRKMIEQSLKVLDSETPLLTIDEINRALERNYQALNS